MWAIRQQLEIVGLGPMWLDSDLDALAEEIARRRRFALEGSASARALVLADGLTHNWRGDFDRALDALAEAAATATAHGDHRAEVLARAGTAAVRAVRGELGTARAEFDAALAAAGAVGLPSAEVFVRAMRIGLFGLFDPEVTEADLERIRHIASEDPGLALHADMAEGWALAAVGRTTEAIGRIGAVTDRLDAPLDRALNRLRMAELLTADDRTAEATDLALDAASVFEERRARYWQARSAVLLASLDGDRRSRRIRTLAASMPDDVAFRRLLGLDGDLVIDLAGPVVLRRGDEPVQFLTRHAEATLRLLAAAGPEGVPVDEVTSILWPGVDGERVRQRGRTMVWQIRTALGPDAWRVQRRRDHLTLDARDCQVIGRLDRNALVAAFADQTSSGSYSPRS